jgi:hypothetical protein
MVFTEIMAVLPDSNMKYNKYLVRRQIVPAVNTALYGVSVVDQILYTLACLEHYQIFRYILL